MATCHETNTHCCSRRNLVTCRICGLQRRDGLIQCFIVMWYVCGDCMLWYCILDFQSQQYLTPERIIQHGTTSVSALVTSYLYTHDSLHNEPNSQVDHLYKLTIFCDPSLGLPYYYYLKVVITLKWGGVGTVLPFEVQRKHAKGEPHKSFCW